MSPTYLIYHPHLLLFYLLGTIITTRTVGVEGQAHDFHEAVHGDGLRGRGQPCLLQGQHRYAAGRRQEDVRGHQKRTRQVEQVTLWNAIKPRE